VRPYTAILPKILLPLRDRPVLEFALRQLRRGGVHQVTIATGHMIELVEALFASGDPYGLDLRCHREHTPLGTAGALAVVPGLGEPFVVLAGPVLTDLDYARMMAHHRQTGAAMTVATTVRDTQVPLGVLRFHDAADGTRVTDYDEKPTYRVEAATGIYACSPRVLDHVTPGEAVDLPELLHRLIAVGEDVRAFRSDAKFLDVGAYRDYDRAVAAFDELALWLDVGLSLSDAA
jgi:NDP-sugar pyrophosphorylase family protein